MQEVHLGKWATCRGVNKVVGSSISHSALSKNWQGTSHRDDTALNFVYLRSKIKV